MKLADLFVKLRLKKEGFDSGIQQAETKARGFGSVMKKVGGAIAGFFAVKAIINWANEAMKAYNKQIAAEQSLLVALRGRRDIQKDLIKQASQLQKVTLFADEDTIKAQANLAMLGLNAKAIKELIPLVQDFAAAQKMDLFTASTLVAKSVGSSTNALSRYGLTITGAVGSSGRLKSAVSALTKTFGGQAKVLANIGTGPLVQLKNAWGDLTEKIGRSVAKTILPGIKMLTILVDKANKAAALSDKTQKYTPEGTYSKSFLQSADLKTLQKELAVTKEQSDIFFQDWKAAKESGNEDKRAFYAGAFDKTKEKIEQLNTAIGVTSKKKTFEKPISEAKAYQIAISDAEFALKSFLSKQGEYHGEKSAQAMLDKWQKLKKAIEDAKKALAEYQQKTQNTDKLPIDSITPKGISSSVAMNITPALKINTDDIDNSLAGFYDHIQDVVGSFQDTLNNTINQGIGNAANSLGELLGNMMAGITPPKDFGKEALAIVGDFIKIMGQMLIAYAVQMGIVALNIGNPTAWPLVLAAGVAMVSVGSAISAHAKNGLSGGGGVSSSSTYAPASGYNNYSGSNGATAIAGNVVFKLEGTALKGVLNNVDTKNYLIR